MQSFFCRLVVFNTKELTLWGPNSTPSSSPRLLDQIRLACQRRHYSPRTAKSYCYWARQYILFHHKRHPRELGKAALEAFLNHLAAERHVSASTQSQALNALVFLYRQVLEMDLGWLDKLERVKRKRFLPVVLSIDEVKCVFSHMSGTPKLMAELIYGTGMRVNECTQLRVKDVDLTAQTITVRAGNRAALSTDKPPFTLAHLTLDRTEGISCSRGQSPSDQTRSCAYLTALLCDALAHGRYRYPHVTNIVRP